MEQDTLYEQHELGPLTESEFLAAKSFIKPVLSLEEANLNEMRLVRNGIQYRVDEWPIYNDETKKLELEEGDQIEMTGTVKTVSGNTKTFTAQQPLMIENIRDAQFDPETGYLLFDADKYCIHNNPGVEKDRKIIEQAIADDKYWVSQEELNKAISPDMTYQDFQRIRELHEREETERHKQSEVSKQRFSEGNNYENIQEERIEAAEEYQSREDEMFVDRMRKFE